MMTLGLGGDRCRRRDSRSGEWTCYQRRGSDLDLALALARVRKGMREGVAREWTGSQVAMPMRLARVWTRVAEGARL